MIETVLSYYSHGGLILIVIAVLSIILWVLIFERYFYFNNEIKDSLSVYDIMKDKLKTHRKEYVLSNDCVIVRLLEEIINCKSDKSIYSVNIKNKIESELKRSDRFISLIFVLAKTAPLLGLLGTVNGMITTFNVLNIFGTGNIKALSGGISQALITTQAGLIIAIPGLFAAVRIQRKAERFKDELKKIFLRFKRMKYDKCTSI